MTAKLHAVQQQTKETSDARPGRNHGQLADVQAVCRQLAATESPRSLFGGTVIFGGLLFICGAAPWLLPHVLVAFVAICLPLRAISFSRQKWQFFLVDFCYFVNIAAAIQMLWYPDNVEFSTLVYALADGPLAAALVAWQCTWLLDSAEHTTSVMMHLLPGLAAFALRHHTPSGVRSASQLLSYLQQLPHSRDLPQGAVPALVQPQLLWWWLFGAPLLFYCSWQAVYYVIVQVLFRRLIQAGGYDTSYNCLARRAAKTNNFWNRLVRRGSITRRCAVYGLLQLGFTMVALLVFLPTYFCYPLAVLYQVIKLAFPLYYGAKYSTTKLPKHHFLQGLQLLEQQQHSTQQQSAWQRQPAASDGAPVFAFVADATVQAAATAAAVGLDPADDGVASAGGGSAAAEGVFGGGAAAGCPATLPGSCQPMQRRSRANKQQS